MKRTSKDDLNSSDPEEEDTVVFVYDRRSGNNPQEKIRLGGIFDFAAFRSKVQQALKLTKDKFVIVNTDRKEIKDNSTYEDLIEGGDTLYVLNSVDQELSAPTQQKVEYIPHYDTLVKSGMYEYYASEGQNPLPFAFAELIDNALAATADNVGSRSIEIRLMFDDATGKHCVAVLDNGAGMSPKELNNWAIYRLSKFNRTSLKPRTDAKETPRSLNSDISYFGVGGKQACFFIGSATRMITKTKDCADVHELCLSTAEFERKERNKESIYSGSIHNRRPGDSEHIAADEESVKKILSEEVNKPCFTAVIISGVSNEHVLYLKANFKLWCRQLAHIYHYYLHGPRGNEKIVGRRMTESPFRNIDIQVVIYEKGRQPRRMELREIQDDMQTLYIRSAASVFEFRAHVENAGIVEGVLRYHPFLYDRETFPTLDGEVVVEHVEDPSGEITDSRAPRGHRPVFECYWNGRLIPYTAIDNLEWCQPPKKRNIPMECYNRFSGVLWTDDAFQVSTNKLTFMDLEVKLKEKSTIFNRVILGQEQRVNMTRVFMDWIRECHENHDKQVKFMNFQGQIKRPELTQKRSQSPWCVYNAIEWDGKVYKVGQIIRTQRTVPLVCGTIKRFMLYGDHTGDVFATGGEMEIVQEPVSLYGEVKVLPLAKLDQSITTSGVKKFIEEEEEKLPSKLVIDWPEGDKLEPNTKVPAGSTIGAMKVDIVNGKGESISKLPGDRKKLLIELKVLWHGGDKEGDKMITHHMCQHGGKSWPYWFRKMENITHLGPHSLQLQVLVSDSSTAAPVKGLPSHKIKFTVIEGKPDKFSVGMLDNPLRVAVPFQIPVNLLDEFDNPCKANNDITPVLSASGLDISYSGTLNKNNSLIIKGVTAVGVVPSHAGKDFNLKITIPGLEEDSQSLKIRLLPGPPEKLVVTPAADEINIENGSPLHLQVNVQDKAGNNTAQPRLNVICKLTGSPGLPTYIGDCSTSGKATLSGADILLKDTKNSTKLKAKIELQHHKDVEGVEKTIVVTPSTKAATLEVYHQAQGTQAKKLLEDGQEIHNAAGESVSGLSFRILDEGQRELNVDNSLAGRIKVNWIPKAPKDLMKQGLLPDIKAPTSVNEPKYCQVSLTGGTGLEFSFTVKSIAGEPAVLKCVCPNPKLRLGESLISEITVTLLDKNGNAVTKLPSGALPDFVVSCPKLKEREVQIGQSLDGSVVIKNIQFEDGITLGSREVSIAWRKIKCYQRIEVIAGPPTKLTLPNITDNEPLSVYNDCPLPVPLVVQLCDSCGNPSTEAGVKVVLNADKGVKLAPAPAPQKTDEQGRASFGTINVSAARGMYGIRIKALQGRSTIDAPTVNVRVAPDPTKPVKIVSDFDFKTPCRVGETLPVVRVHVIAEDESTMKGLSAKDFVLKIWLSKDCVTSGKPPATATTLYLSRKAPGDKADNFYFRNLKVPEVAGPYSMIVHYGPSSLSSKVMSFTAYPGLPVKLEPDSIPATPTVSNTNKNTSRMLVRNLKLLLKDRFDNLTGENLRGKVTLRVMCATEGIDEIPALQGNLYTMAVPLHKGCATFTDLMIQENTAGKDGQEYLLNFQGQIPANASPHPIPPFTMPFLFYNDVRKQQQMAQLTKERDHLFETIRTYRSLFETTRQLINEMQVSVHEAALQEQKLRGELRKQNVPAASLSSPQNVDVLIADLTRKRSQMATAPRRQCLLHPGPRGEIGILGKVAHLAQVIDDDVARVLSWHMASDMDCVVTLTTEKAKQVYRDSSGQQQVLPLDSIYRRSLPEWNRPLPHIRSGPANYNPSGNPVYARDMLIFQAETDNCKLVFGMLLGDTLILDDLDCANKYRQELVKHTHCPTILTRTGDRIRSNGKFGGLQNRAPPLDRMRGAVFAAPLPLNYHNMSIQIDQLQSYKQALVKHIRAKEDLSFQLQRGQTEEMKVKHRECREAEAQLRMIEETLGMTPTQYDMPASPATMLHTELNNPPVRTAANRRARGSAVASPSSRQVMTNGTNSNVSQLPSRGTRRSAAAVASAEESGRSKRTRR